MPAPSHAFFFALKPDARAVAQLLALGRRLREKHGLTGRLFAAERLHVTLHYFGRFATLDEALVERLIHAGDGVHAEPFEVRFDHVGSFGRPSNAPLVMRMAEDASGIKAMHERLTSALVQAGIATRLENRFVPHLTLLYDDKSLPEHEVDPVDWTADFFDLVHSETGRGHRVLHRWPLRGD